MAQENEREVVIAMTLKRQSRAYRDFAKKVQLLEKWVAEGMVPEGIDIPTGPSELACWHDVKLGVCRWSSPNIASPNGPYSDLRARFDRCVECLRPKAEKKAKDLSAENIQLKRFQKALAEQNATLIEEIDLLRNELTRQTQLYEILKQREQEATRKLAKLLRFTSA